MDRGRPLGQTLTRVLDAADLAGVETLVRRCFGTGLPAAIDRHLLLHEGGVLKAYAAGRRIGLPDGQQAYLLGLVCVDPEARGRGWGRMLVERFADEARTVDRLGVVLNCGAAMVGFYLRLGFVPVASSASYDRGGRRVVDADPVLWRGLQEDPGPPVFGDPVFLGTDL